jgi:hypothetical protein
VADQELFFPIIADESVKNTFSTLTKSRKSLAHHLLDLNIESGDDWLADDNDQPIPQPGDGDGRGGGGGGGGLVTERIQDLYNQVQQLIIDDSDPGIRIIQEYLSIKLENHLTDEANSINNIKIGENLFNLPTKDAICPDQMDIFVHR